MTTRRLVPVCLLVAGLLAATAAAAGSTLVRLDGIGPVKLTMSRSAAVATGWLAHRGKGCGLGGPPVPVTYDFSGPKAPAGLSGTAQFDGGKLSTMVFTEGVRTALGVTIGTTPRTMAKRYRAAGYSVSSQFLDTFGGTYVTVKRHGKTVLSGFATKGRIESVGVPTVPLCD